MKKHFLANKLARKSKNQKGITLVALVVTIVVLLILAGITITTLFSDNGIIARAREAKNKTELDKTDTENKLENLAGQLEDKLTQAGIGGGTSGGTVTVGKKVDPSTKYLNYTDSTSSEPVPIPGGYCVVNGENNTIEKGLVISDVEGDDMNNSKQGNQFVWVPVPNVIWNGTSTISRDNTPMAVLQSGSETNYRGVLYDFGTSSSPKDPPQPYSYSPNSGYREPAIVDNSSDGTGTSYDGASSNINPVLEDKYKDTTGTKKIQEQFKDQLQAEFNSMVASVNKYKGFYIGRYETGGFSGTKTVVQKGKTDINNKTWYEMYNKSKTIKGENTNVTTSMIWGCQWDQVMNWWLKDNSTKGYVTDSTGKGNYSGSKIATGDDRYAIKNIYDMAGNVWDWTIEAYGTSSRVARGGYYGGSGSSYPASYRVSSYDSTGSFTSYGSRSTLLVNP